MRSSGSGVDQRSAERIFVEPPLSFALLESLLPIGGSELEHAGAGPVGQQVEEGAQIGPRLDAVHLAAGDEGHEDGVRQRAVFGADEDFSRSTCCRAASVVFMPGTLAERIHSRHERGWPNAYLTSGILGRSEPVSGAVPPSCPARAHGADERAPDAPDTKRAARAALTNQGKKAG